MDQMMCLADATTVGSMTARTAILAPGGGVPHLTARTPSSEHQVDSPTVGPSGDLVDNRAGPLPTGHR